MYNESVEIPEGDIYIYCDPDYYPTDYPKGLAVFDADYNCAAVLGMRYFGELKKGTLTLAWTIAERNGLLHVMVVKNALIYLMGKSGYWCFGLSGSGKSTITLSDHGGKFETTVLHDDAFIISNHDASSVSLEQSYFDKTQDYPLTNPQSKYFLTVQNAGATIDENGRLVPVTGDIRNGNGRTVKSKLATPNREYKFDTPVNSIFWIMKDASLPPVIKVNSPSLASAMGATLATKRTTAEYVPGEDPDKLVIVPYANPFRLYPLVKDYNKFKSLFADMNVDCYIINTGFFLDKKVTPQVTLGIIEDIVTEKAQFEPFGSFADLEYLPIEGYHPDFNDPEYVKQVKDRMKDRLSYVEDLDEFNRLPEEALAAIKKLTV